MHELLFPGAGHAPLCVCVCVCVCLCVCENSKDERLKKTRGKCIQNKTEGQGPSVH
jgi:hypothetical protein